jgi:glycosyltransferase involved in cell wall biosynthesis
VERHTDNLAKLLIGKGHIVTIVTQIGEKKIENDQKLTIVRKPNLALLFYLVFKHDIIHMQGFNIFTYAFARILRKKVVWYHHTFDLCSVGGGTSIYKGFLGTLEEYLKRNISGILLWISFHVSRIIAKIDKRVIHITTTYYMLKKFNYFLIHKNRYVIYCPVFFKTNNERSKNGEYVLLFGRMMAGKGEDVLIKSIRILKDKGFDIRALICGPTPNPNYPKNLIRYYNLENNVIYLGPKHDDELIKIIKESKLVVVPSTYEEMFGQTAIEAMILGKPVIASSTGGLAEVVGDRGILVKAGDAKELAEAILRLWNDEEICEKLGKKAMEYAMQNFHHEKFINRYLEIVLK